MKVTFQKKREEAGRGIHSRLEIKVSNEDFIRGSFRSKSVYFTDAGIMEAKKLMEKYLKDLE